MVRRCATWGLLSIASIVLILAVALVYISFKNYDAEFASRKGNLAASSLEPAGQSGKEERYWLTLQGDAGLTVQCGLLVPRDKGIRFPAFILLGGKATGKYAIDYALGAKDVIIVAPDYSYEPRESYAVLDVLTDLPRIHQVLFDMVPSVELVMDYLRTREDVDTGRVVMLGYSFGAPYVPILASRDHRFAAAAMVYGGGDLRSMIHHNVRRYEGPLFSTFVGFLSGLLLRPMEPLHYVKNISPTPLIMINGEQDEQVPRENTEMLFAAAREPKRIIWLPSHHVNPRDTTLTRTIIRTLSQELGNLGVLPPDSHQSEDFTSPR
jgi:dienelactone hydrolase